MLVTINTVENIIFRGLESLNDDLESEQKIKICHTTPLFGVDAEIDSLSLVSLIVDIETELNSTLDLSISLTDDKAMAREQSPFVRVDALRDYILELVNEPN